jgi:hypothetical protein
VVEFGMICISFFLFLHSNVLFDLHTKKLVTVVHAWNVSTQEAEARGSWVKARLSYMWRPCIKKKKKTTLTIFLYSKFLAIFFLILRYFLPVRSPNIVFQLPHRNASFLFLQTVSEPFSQPGLFCEASYTLWNRKVWAYLSLAKLMFIHFHMLLKWVYLGTVY